MFYILITIVYLVLVVLYSFNKERKDTKTAADDLARRSKELNLMKGR